MFEELGLQVEVMWRTKEKGLTGSEVREASMKEMGLDVRVRKGL